MHTFRDEAGERLELDLISPDFDVFIGLASSDGTILDEGRLIIGTGSNPRMAVTFNRAGSYGVGLTTTQVDE